MPRILFAVLVLVALFFAVPVLLRVLAFGGPLLVAVCGCLFAVGAAWSGHTPETAAMAADLLAELKARGISQKEAAITAEVSEPTFTNWMNGKERPPLWLLAKLGKAVRVGFYKRQLEREECVVLERGEMCDLVNAVQALTVERRRPRPIALRAGVA